MCSLQAPAARLWKLKWDNANKEPLWRLAVNGVRGAGADMHGIPLPGPCPCGWEGPPAVLPDQSKALAWRRHYFWDCHPVAGAVRSEILSVLQRVQQLSRAHVWLLQPPQLDGGTSMGMCGRLCVQQLLLQWSLENAICGRCTLMHMIMMT